MVAIAPNRRVSHQHRNVLLLSDRSARSGVVALATPPTLVGVDAPAEADLDLSAEAFQFQLTDMPENMTVHGAVTDAAPKVFLKYFFVNTKTGEKSGEMLATVKLG